MRGILPQLFFAAFLTGFAWASDDLVVASIRQYQLVGTSNIHLYLCGLDGTLKKQLTNVVGCNDVDPKFSSDGHQVYFHRTSTLPQTSQQSGLYVLDLETEKVTRADNDESWVSVPMENLEYSFAPLPGSWNVAEKPDCLSPDGQYRIQIKNLPSDNPNSNAPTEHLLSIRGQPPFSLTKLPGFMPADQISGYESLEQLNGTPFVTGPGFAAVFLVHHLDSTDGDQIWGLDLQTRQWTKMSQNGGDLYHPPGASGVFLAADSLYEPLGRTGKTVNCCYLEWWDEHLRMTKLTPPLSVFYSAAIFHMANETLILGEGHI